MTAKTRKACSQKSDVPTTNEQEEKLIQHLINISETNIQYLHKNVIIPLLCQCGFLIHTCVSKSATVSKDKIFYLQ